MISTFLPIHAADAVALDFGVFIAEQARTHRVSQTAIIAALRPFITPLPKAAGATIQSDQPDARPEGSPEISGNPEATPSQPETSSHAPAAQTDGEASPHAAPSVAPDTSAVTAVEEQARHDLVDEGTPLPEHVDAVVADSLPGAECAEDRAPIPEAPKPLPDDEEMRRPAEAKTSEAAGGITFPPDGGAVSAVKGANARLENAEGVEPPPSTPPRQTKRQQVIDCHEANPDWNSFQIAEHLGFGAAHVQVIAGQCGIKLPPAPRPEQPNMRDKVIAVVETNPGLTTRQIAEAAGCSLGTAARWAKEAREKPQEAAAPSPASEAQPAAELPPLSKPSERLRPLPEDDVSDVLHKPRKAPSGRFYLRDKVTGHFVHQSLQPASHGDGPMMTMDRKWAWYDTLDRYRGAKKRWPQIAELRKEAVSK